MTSSNFYLKVTTLPLLQGMSAENILIMQERKAIRIVSMEPEEGDIIQEGQHCCTLTMLMEGTLACITQGEGWTLEEEIIAPAIIEEEALWSLSQTYHHNYRPLSEGKLLVIDRHHIMKTMLHNDVFRINLLTRMSTRLERNYLCTQTTPPVNIIQKIARFLQRIASTPTWPKCLNIKMTTLAEIVGETRLQVSKTLRQMENEGHISLAREKITFNTALTEYR
jgi:CRP-like cAMP-binding protein